MLLRELSVCNLPCYAGLFSDLLTCCVWQLLVDKASGAYHFWTRWGRVGEGGQSSLESTYGSNMKRAVADFEKKFKVGLQAAHANRFPYVTRIFLIAAMCVCAG